MTKSDELDDHSLRQLQVENEQLRQERDTLVLAWEMTHRETFERAEKAEQERDLQLARGDDALRRAGEAENALRAVHNRIRLWSRNANLLAPSEPAEKPLHNAPTESSNKQVEAAGIALARWNIHGRERNPRFVMHDTPGENGYEDIARVVLAAQPALTDRSEAPSRKEVWDLLASIRSLREVPTDELIDALISRGWLTVREDKE